MERRTFLRAAAAAGVVGLAGCSASGGLSESDYDVGMTPTAFDPAEYEASVGDTVVWGNTSSRAHTVTAYEDEIPSGADYFASGGFSSQQAAENAFPGKGGITSGETYEHTFEVPGAYGYFCIPHEAAGMKGTIVVTE